MGKKCCVPECKSGYASTSAESEAVKPSMHRFPIENIDLRNQWIRNIPRKD